MALRNIVHIDPKKCNGCGLCVTACAEGAIALVDGKARLVSDTYCDGLGVCLGHCPQGAITIEQRQAAEFDAEAVSRHRAQPAAAPVAADTTTSPTGHAACPQGSFVCPGARTLSLAAPAAPTAPTAQTAQTEPPHPQSGPADGGPGQRSQLGQWPVQLHLVNPQAPYFQNAELLLTADCVALAMGDFHARLLRGRAVAIGCPKLDDRGAYIDKLAQIITLNSLRRLLVVHMEVPCCGGLLQIARQAIAQAGVELPCEDMTISLTGDIIKTETIRL
ncbi:MAG: 4Fe-4S binding protein [Sedimentisphaerales bacterium]|nr:4Fe-4S binding protein [Sedimentisphaerales bacterium]